MRTTLETAAGKDTTRLKILADRKVRTHSRSRFRECPTCDDKVLDCLPKTDICDACLTDLWNARDIKAGEFKSGQSSGLVPYRLCNVYHWLDYPRTATQREEIPKKAVFARFEDERRTADTSRTLQLLTVELIQALAPLSPCDPLGRHDAEPIIPGSHNWEDSNQIFLRLPKKAVDVIRALWALMEWHSHEAFRQGFDDGRNLLSKMNVGDIGYEGFIAEVAKQIGRAQDQQQKIAAGAKRG